MAPSASMISICTAVLTTWSSPRITWVIAEVDVVDDRWQRVEIGSVLAHQHRIGEGGRVDVLGPADQVVPFDPAVVELEAPMRPATLGFECGAFLIASA